MLGVQDGGGHSKVSGEGKSCVRMGEIRTNYLLVKLVV